MVQINMVGLRALLESAVHFGVKRFILVSSMAVLGNRPSHDLDETAPYVVTGDNYNFTKMEAEKIARRVHREQGLPLIMLRPPYIYGPHDRNFLPRVVTAIERGKFIFIGDGMNPISLCYVGNLVDAMIRCLDSERTDARIYHLTDGEPVTRKALVNYIADELDLMRPTKHLPFWFAKGLMHAMETVANLRNAEQAPLLNTFRMKFLHTPLTFSIRRAQEELGYGPPFAFKDAMKTTLEWFKRSR
jgi:nucleoside-diphosphate-sugar epimerase